MGRKLTPPVPHHLEHPPSQQPDVAAAPPERGTVSIFRRFILRLNALGVIVGIDWCSRITRNGNDGSSGGPDENGR